MLFGFDSDVAEFVGKNMEREFAPPFTAIGVLDQNGNLVGGMVFSDYTGSNIEITIYGPGLMSRKVVSQCFDYVFNQLKCSRLTARTRRSNRLMRKLLPRLGFDYEATIKHYFGTERGDDALLFRLTPEYASKWT